MRVTMNDGRQMVGQMLAFDKVRSVNESYSLLTDYSIAHEPRPRRYRRVQTCKAKANQIVRTRRSSGTSRRIRREENFRLNDC